MIFPGSPGQITTIWGLLWVILADALKHFYCHSLGWVGKIEEAGAW